MNIEYMEKEMIRIAALLAALLSPCALPAQAQRTPADMGRLAVNENVTTVITASEPVRLVDISTDMLAGDQPIGNTIRLKPRDGGHGDGDLLAVVTIVTERYRVQYAMVYTSRASEAVADKEISPDERTAYADPAVSMSTEDMYRYARRVWLSPPRFRNVSSRGNRLRMRLDNIYAAGEYFFIGFSVENRTDVRFDIDQLRLRLLDRRTARSATSQELEMEPALVLEPAGSFLHGYRNVVVIRKMTFPNDKVLRIELSERQVSGRTISLTVDYEDVLSADGFDPSLPFE